MVNCCWKAPHLRCLQKSWLRLRRFWSSWIHDLNQTYLRRSRSCHCRCSVRKGVPRNFAKFSGKHLCQSLFINKVVGLRSATLLKKETLAQLFSCQFCKISKEHPFYRTPLAAASDVHRKPGGFTIAIKLQFLNTDPFLVHRAVLHGLQKETSLLRLSRVSLTVLFIIIQ